MRAVVVREFGDESVLEVQELAPPVAGPGELAISVSVAGVNFIDLYQRAGLYPLHPPFVAGSEGAGVVEGVGEDVEGFAVGDRVAWLMAPGAGYAEQVTAPASRCVVLPPDVDDRSAAAVMLQGITAHYLTHSTYPVQAGDHVLVHAAAGGVGRLLTQVATSLGARVIATVSTEEKAQVAREAGAWATIDYSRQDVADEVRGLTDGRGVQVVYDGVGRDTRSASLASLGRRGMYVVHGQASGAPDPVSPKELSSGGSLFFTRPTVVDYIADTSELAARAEQVFTWLRDGTISPHVGRTYALEDAAQAQRDLGARRTVGKSLLIP